MNFILVLFFLLFPLFSFAEDQIVNKEPQKSLFDKILDKSKSGLESSKEFIQQRSEKIQTEYNQASDNSLNLRLNYNYGLYLHYAPIDLLIPSKKGVSFHFNSDENKVQHEFQYLKGSYSIPLLIADIGKIQDERISYLRRKFVSDSNFNWYWGLSYVSFDATIGPDLLNYILPGNIIPNIDLIDIRTIGLDLGIGHRWYFKTNFSVSLDWLAITQPLIILKKEAPYLEAQNSSESEKDSFKKSIDLITYFPRFSVIKLGIGYNF